MKKYLLLIQKQLAQLKPISPTLRKKFTGYGLAITVLVSNISTSYVCAGGLWDVAKNVCKTIYEEALEISTPFALVTSAICLLTLFFIKNEKAVEASWKWLKRIVACWILIHCLALILTTINDTIGTDSTASSFDVNLE